MSARYHEFRGHQWLSQPMKLQTGSLRLVADDYLRTGDPVAYARVGKKATVYKVIRDGRHMALKVFKKRYALSENILTSIQLNSLKTRPGLSVCSRRWIDVAEAEDIGEPGLAWAILMPWIDGEPWTALIESRRVLTQDHCLALARYTAMVLAALESDEYVHADISSSNVFVQNLDGWPRIELIDVEDMYHPAFVEVRSPPDGTAGYAHPKNVGLGCRNPYGDRFAGGVLLTEMVVWQHPELRAAAMSDSLFAPRELCRPGAKFDAVAAALDGQAPQLGALFRRLWWSSGLDTCPTLQEWKSALADVNPELTPLRRALWTSRLETEAAQRVRQDQQQTSLLEQSYCSECGQWIPDFEPSAHETTCSRHPASQKQETGAPLLLPPDPNQKFLPVWPTFPGWRGPPDASHPGAW
ncbi:hypothetical protein JNUCC0626_27140 [Lentzea sp. JNUCC 0626]|uniref:hypothetical protein n=1 Tax=Lentzea sp. JNUCC 0626 TaxID=3367513 RepID=UPI00374951FB